MKTMLFFIFMLFPLLAFSQGGYTLVLSNESALIILDMKCSPCDIECKKINYRFFDTKTSFQTSGEGTSLNAGASRNFVGYKLFGHKEIYTLSANPTDDSWDLIKESELHVVSKSKINTVFDSGVC